FPVAAEAVPVDGRVGNHDFSVAINRLAIDLPVPFLGGVADIEFPIVFGSRELEGAEDMVFGITVVRENIAAADGVDG
ncbi:MAG: hypothetical protein ACK56I_06060, partial [bacterium]